MPCVMCTRVQRHVGNYSVKELIVAILGAPSAVSNNCITLLYKKTVLLYCILLYYIYKTVFITSAVSRARSLCLTHCVFFLELSVRARSRCFCLIIFWAGFLIAGTSCCCCRRVGWVRAAGGRWAASVSWRTCRSPSYLCASFLSTLVVSLFLCFIVLFVAAWQTNQCFCSNIRF